MAIILNTSAGRLADWLVQRTRAANQQPIPRENGRAILHPARPRAPGRLTMVWDCIIPDRKNPNAETAYGPLDAIAFELQELAAERVEFCPSCRDAIFLPYLTGLLDDLAERWPEARPGVEAFLGRPQTKADPRGYVNPQLLKKVAEVDEVRRRGSTVEVALGMVGISKSSYYRGKKAVNGGSKIT